MGEKKTERILSSNRLLLLIGRVLGLELLVPLNLRSTTRSIINQSRGGARTSDSIFELNTIIPASAWGYHLGGPQVFLFGIF